MIEFEILADYRIRVRLSNDDCGVFDVKPCLSKGIFRGLEDYDYFKRARLELGTITWPNEQDFCPETIETKMARE